MFRPTAIGLFPGLAGRAPYKIKSKREIRETVRHWSIVCLPSFLFLGSRIRSSPPPPSRVSLTYLRLRALDPRARRRRPGPILVLLVLLLIQVHFLPRRQRRLLGQRGRQVQGE